MVTRYTLIARKHKYHLGRHKSPMETPYRFQPPRICFIPVSESWLLHRRVDMPAAAVHLPDCIAWLVDGDLIEEELFEPLGKVATEAASVLTPRIPPAAEPWGEFRFTAEDIYPDELIWQIKDFGYYIPAPKKFIRPKLIQAASLVGTRDLRRFIPPSPNPSGA